MKQTLIIWEFFKGSRSLEDTIRMYIDMKYKIITIVPMGYVRELFGTESITKALIVAESPI